MTAPAEIEAQPGKWLMRVEGRDYGPFGIDQLRAFVAEHRFVPESVVSEPGADRWRRAGDDPNLAALFAARAPAEDAEIALHTFMIYFESKGYTPPAFEQTVEAMHNAHRLGPNVWLVQSGSNAAGLRNDLTQKLGRHDSLLIVDAGRAKGAWHNIGPESESRLRLLLRRR